MVAAEETLDEVDSFGKEFCGEYELTLDIIQIKTAPAIITVIMIAATGLLFLSLTASFLAAE